MDSFEIYYQQIALEKTKAVDLQTFVEMPQYYPGKMAYQRDAKFVPISINNINTFDVLGSDGDSIFLLAKEKDAGYVINRADYEQAKMRRTDIVPVMVVRLRDTTAGVKQAHSLRIREQYSRENIATTWYILYVMRNGAIASDFEHLEGGKVLWRSLIDKARQRGMSTFLYDVSTGEKISVDETTPDHLIWSTGNDDKKQQLIILQSNG